MLGPRSEHLVAVDFDEESFGLQFDALNPEIAEGTTRSTARRGWQIWLRMIGPYPPSEKTPQCEWRAEGCLSTIAGVHPQGMPYRIINDVPPMSVRYEDLKWPEGWPTPGLRRLQEEALRAMVERYGEPLFTNPKGDVNGINEPFWAALYGSRHTTLWCPEEERFYLYDDATGLWTLDSEQMIRQRLGALLLEQSRAMNVPWLSRQRSQRALASLSSQVANVTAKPRVFSREARIEHLLHTANAVLIWRGDEWQVEPFSPDFYSRNASPIAYVPGATCPRFMGELLSRCLCPDDIRILQMVAGMYLLWYNLLQIIVIIDGEAGTGKSQISDVLRGLVGRHNCVNLRTDLLHERFEIANYLSKSLLIGSDVNNDFLANRGAPTLKALVGGDLLMAELKGVAGSQAVDGHFNVLITSNSRLRLRLQDDVDAWKRRLVILTSEGTPPERAIPDFGGLLLREEGPGILNWAIDGVRLLFDELKAGNGRLRLSDGQRKRVQTALAESDSLRIFLGEGVRWDSASDVTVEEIMAAYANWCADREISPMPDGVAQRVLPTLMLELYQAARRNDIERRGRQKRGFCNVTLVSAKS